MAWLSKWLDILEIKWRDIELSNRRMINWVTIRACLMLILVSATKFGTEWLSPIVVFCIWGIAICLFIVSFDDDTRRQTFKLGHAVDRRIVIAYDVIFFFVLMVYGWFWTAGIYLLQIAVYRYMYTIDPDLAPEDKPKDEIRDIF